MHDKPQPLTPNNAPSGQHLQGFRRGRDAHRPCGWQVARHIADTARYSAVQSLPPQAAARDECGSLSPALAIFRRMPTATPLNQRRRSGQRPKANPEKTKPVLQEAVLQPHYAPRCPTEKSFKPVRSSPRSNHRGRVAKLTGTPVCPCEGCNVRSNSELPGM